MRLGIVTDVHNHAAELAEALAVFRKHGVDLVVTIGDTCDAFGRDDGAGEVAALLADCSAIGVWGNHDFTLCRDVPDEVRNLYPPVVLDVMARMEPRLVIEDAHFSHKESSIDPHDIAQLWEFSDSPIDLMVRAQRAFTAVTSQWQFIGHYHRWWAATPAGRVDWGEGEPLQFEPGLRYFVVVAPVFEGWCGILDTQQGNFRPLRCSPTEMNATI